MNKEDMFWKFGGLAIALVYILAAGYAQSCGLLLTHDSRQYLAAAQSFRNSFELVGENGTSYTYWSPLFPVLLSISKNPTTTLPWINIGVQAILVWLVWRFSNLVLLKRSTFIFSLAFIFWSVHNLLISVFIWSELIFLVLMFSFLLAIRSINSGRGLALAIALGFLLCLQRNAGLFILAGAVLWLFLISKEPLGQRVKIPIILFLGSSAGLWCWNIGISVSSNGDFRFYDQAFFQSTWHNYKFLSQAWTRAYVPLSSGGWVLLPVVFCALIYLLKERLRSRSLHGLLLLTLLTYIVGMAFMFHFDPHDGDRYLSVVLPLSTLLMLAGFETISSHWPKMITSLILVACLVYPVARAIKNVKLWHEMSCSGVSGNK